jgi:hypothetical protein
MRIFDFDFFIYQTSIQSLKSNWTLQLCPNIIFLTTYTHIHNLAKYKSSCQSYNDTCPFL